MYVQRESTRNRRNKYLSCRNRLKKQRKSIKRPNESSKFKNKAKIEGRVTNLRPLQKAKRLKSDILLNFIVLVLI